MSDAVLLWRMLCPVALHAPLRKELWIVEVTVGWRSFEDFQSSIWKLRTLSIDAALNAFNRQQHIQ